MQPLADTDPAAMGENRILRIGLVYFLDGKLPENFTAIDIDLSNIPGAESPDTPIGFVQGNDMVIGPRTLSSNC